jgi:hypothetical protein
MKKIGDIGEISDFASCYFYPPACPRAHAIALYCSKRVIQRGEGQFNQDRKSLISSTSPIGRGSVEKNLQEPRAPGGQSSFWRHRIRRSRSRTVTADRLAQVIENLRYVFLARNRGLDLIEKAAGVVG